MELEYYAILTEIGTASIANAAVLGKKVALTQFAVGDGGGSYYRPTKEMTALKGEKWRGEINSYEVDSVNADLINVKAVIPAAIGGFTIREMGLFDDTGQLIAVANTPDSVKITTDSGAVKEMEMVMELLVSNSNIVSIQVNPTVSIATKEDINKHNESPNAHIEQFNQKANKIHNHAASDINSGTLPIDRGGTGNTTGNAATATKLKTARTVQTNLASTSSASFDGSANITPGVTGTLPIANGGTGNTTGNAATATKLKTARTLALSGDVTGSVSFDGSANKTIAATLANSGVTAGAYGANLNALGIGTWISNNRGLHNTTATSTWTAKKDMTMSFRYTVSSESTNYDYLNITAAGTQILANTGGATTTNTLTATLKTGQTIVFNYRKDSSNNTNEDCARISEVKVTPTGATSATTITTTNFADYFTAANGTYAFLPLIELQKKSTASGAGTNGFTLPCVTVDSKGRVTTASEVFVMPAESSVPLPVAEGGTGATTVAAARNALGLGNTSGAVPIANGGTGATSASTALSNLGGFSKSGGTISGNVKITGKVAEGDSTTASGAYSHAEGQNTTESGIKSHAEGDSTIASGSYSHAGGCCTVASAIAQTAIGVYNKESTNISDKLIIGNGSSSARSNCFRVSDANGVYSNSAYNSKGADYAEYFQWKDNNTNNEDRIGLFVTLDGDKICLAEPEDDYILGIISGAASVIGDSCEDQWYDMYKTDIYNRPILEEVEIPEKTDKITTINENGEEITETIVIEKARTEIRQVLNPEYDNTQEYIPRSKRPEWATVGMMGKLVVIDDGSCEVNGWCKVGQGGIAIKSEQKTRFRVMKRLDKNHIKVLML